MLFRRERLGFDLNSEGWPVQEPLEGLDYVIRKDYGDRVSEYRVVQPCTPWGDAYHCSEKSQMIGIQLTKYIQDEYIV